ncbi:class II aldolase/adducin family protein [Streptomyces liangshanensis]|uniref:class II aldolase/adducin family protein n=1 Tax=Streptomyces liangshanensis TaxID=2717324 RepID=UPI0036DA6919
MFPTPMTEELARAGRALDAAGLVTAFGHVSARTDGGTLLITPPEPLGRLTADHPGFRALPPGGAALPEGAPREAWIHLAVTAARAEVGAVCRAQPPAATAAAAAGLPLRPLHGQGALLGPLVPVFEDARLVRDARAARALTETLGDAHAVVMLGNGAVTVGRTVGAAVARMWILEQSARLTLAASAAGHPRPLPASQQKAWVAAGPELLDRLWHHLAPAPEPEKSTP